MRSPRLIYFVYVLELFGLLKIYARKELINERVSNFSDFTAV